MLSLMMGHAFDAALCHATKLVYARRVVTRTHGLSKKITAPEYHAGEGVTEPKASKPLHRNEEG